MLWLKQFFSRRRLYADLSEEIRTHIEERVEELVAAGLSRKEAEYAARREFGNVTLTEEDSRTVWRWLRVEDFLLDVRHGLASLRRNPGFAAVAVLTLALGMGATTSIFTVVKAVIFAPLPFRQPENLVHVWEGHEHYHRGDQAYFSSARPGSLYDWREQSHSFESLTAYRWRPRLLTDDKQAELVVAQDVYDQFFETLGTRPQLGRTLQANDYEPSAPKVVVISNAMWTKRFGGDPGLVGRRISLDRESYEIVGVMPPGFYPAPDYPELWTPHWADQAEKDNRNIWGVFALARLKPGVTWEQAQRELDVISARVL